MYKLWLDRYNLTYDGLRRGLRRANCTTAIGFFVELTLPTKLSRKFWVHTAVNCCFP